MAAQPASRSQAAPRLGIEMLALLEGRWLGEIRAWAAGQAEVAEVWLFGSRAKGTARPDSDVDLGLVLMPSERGHDWALGNWLAVGSTWREKLQAVIGRHVSLEAFSRA